MSNYLILKRITHLYERMLVACTASLPLFAIGYLAMFSTLAEICVENHTFHEVAIAMSTLLSGFVAYVTWQSYRESGEVLLRWVTAGFLVLTLIYAPHGLFTWATPFNLWLFILYGPASRLAMIGCMFIGLLQYGKPAEIPDDISHSGFWRRLILLCIAIDVAVPDLVVGDQHIRLVGNK